MKFASPQWLWLLTAIPPLLWLSLRDERRRQGQLAKFADRAVWRSLIPEFDPAARGRKTVAWFAMLAFVILTLARPQWGTHEESVKTTGLDVMIALDVSNSMESEDVIPSRLKKARHLVKSLADRLRGDRMGLVAFAASSYVACPLTTDTDYLIELLQIIGPRMVTNQGTDIGIGLDTARKALERGAEEVSSGPPGPGGPSGSPSAPASRVIILISDGEDQEEGAIQAAKAVQESGAKLYVLGVGTEKGAPVPVRDEAGNLVGHKKDRRGQAVVSAFHPDALMQVAQASGGHYWNVTNDEAEVDEILKDMGALHRSEYAERRYLVFEDRFQWPLAVAVLLLLVEISLPLRKQRRAKKAAAERLAAVTSLWALVMLGTSSTAHALGNTPPVDAYLENEQGLKAFKDGKLTDAQRRFGTAQALDPTIPELQFNEGVVQFQQGEVDGAVRAFGEAAKGSAQRGDRRLEGQSLYNLGGALGKKGDVGNAIRSYLGAIDSAQKSKDAELEADARKNLQLLIRKREQEKQQQKQDQQDKKDQQGKEGEKDPKNEKDDAGKNANNSKNPQDQKDPKDGKDKKDEKNEQAKNQPKQFEDPSKSRKRQFKSPKLSNDDAERVMAELSNRERELQAKLKKQNGNAQSQNNQKDW